MNLLLDNFQQKACSLPPPPNIKMFIFKLFLIKNRKETGFKKTFKNPFPASFYYKPTLFLIDKKWHFSWFWFHVLALLKMQKTLSFYSRFWTRGIHLAKIFCYFYRIPLFHPPRIWFFLFCLRLFDHFEVLAMVDEREKSDFDEIRLCIFHILSHVVGHTF